MKFSHLMNGKACLNKLLQLSSDKNEAVIFIIRTEEDGFRFRQGFGWSNNVLLKRQHRKDFLCKQPV